VVDRRTDNIPQLRSIVHKQKTKALVSLRESSVLVCRTQCPELLNFANIMCNFTFKNCALGCDVGSPYKN